MAWRTPLQVGMSQIRLLNHPGGRGLVALLTRSGYYTRRASGGSSSQVLNEEKRAAAEAVYIKNLEEEKLATLSQKGLTSEEARARLASVSPTASLQVAKAAKVSTDTEKNIAVVSGIIAIISTTCLYLLSSASSKKDTDDEEY
ncbi:unnamed protein product [Sphagnum troendelagicum]|uniref:Uncharacterized protein n=2 Tax=Sphagnum TaxID=13804 RepID=A0ABP0U5C5_9BRYO